MKNIRAVIIMLLISLPVFSQKETVDVLLDEYLFGKSVQDSLLEAYLSNEADINDLLNAITNSSYIYVRSEFENKTYFSGQDLGIKQYNIVNQAFYQGAKGLNIGVSGILYSGFKPKYNTTIASIGYNKRISSINGLSLKAAYNRFFFADIDSIAENSFNSSINLGAAYQLKNIGTSVDFSFLMGNDPSAQFSWDLFSDLTIMKIGLFNRLKFSPEISFYFGNETVVTSAYLNLRRFLAVEYSEKSTFGLMNTVIRVPLSLTYKNLDLRAGYNFNLPRIPGTDIKPEKTSFFNLSVGYLFGL